jgi:hypothetical protein
MPCVASCIDHSLLRPLQTAFLPRLIFAPRGVAKDPPRFAPCHHRPVPLLTRRLASHISTGSPALGWSRTVSLPQPPRSPAKCIDEYIEQRVRAAEAKEEALIDERLVAIVERMFDRCMADGQYRQAVGIALESRRIDRLEQSILQSDDVMATLQYTLNASLKLVASREFRTQVRCCAPSPLPPPPPHAPPSRIARIAPITRAGHSRRPTVLPASPRLGPNPFNAQRSHTGCHTLVLFPPLSPPIFGWLARAITHGALDPPPTHTGAQGAGEAVHGLRHRVGLRLRLHVPDVP